MVTSIALPRSDGMVASVALPKRKTEGVVSVIGRPTIFTFITPAFGGCEFEGCKPWCAIEQMMEQTGHPDPVSLEEYLLFARGLLSGWFQMGGMVSGWAVQGHRAFRADSLPYTRGVLEIGSQVGVPLSVIDVGRNIPENLPWLNTLTIPPILHISIDGGKQVHDKRQAGSFDETVEALLATRRYPAFRDRTYMAFTLMPRKEERLYDLMCELPKELRSIPIVMSPYLEWGGTVHGGPKQTGQAFTNAFTQAKRWSRELGFTVEIGDEFNKLDIDETGELFRDCTVRRFDDCNVLRVLPNLQMLSGTQILTRVTSETPQWLSPARFALSLFEQH